MILQIALDLAAQLRRSGSDLVLVASDHRLLGGASSEGLQSFDPETESEADLDALIDA